MKKVIFLLLICFQSFGQTPLKSIQPCKVGGVVTDSCFIMTDVNGVQTYISYQDLITIVSGGSVACTALNSFTNRVPIATDKVYFNNGSSCYKGTISDLLGINKFNCDSVLACMTSGTLCAALAALDEDNITSTDYIFFENSSGECKKGLVSSISGFGFNCDSVITCLTDGALCEALEALTGGTPTGTDSVFYFHNGQCLKGPISAITGSFNCDSVLACLTDGALCEALEALTGGTPTGTDSVFYFHNGQCLKGPISAITGSFNCDSVLACIGDGTWFCDSIEACLNDGILCNALKDFPFLSVDQNGEVLWITNDGLCRRGNIAEIAATYALCDSLNALEDTEFDTTAGKVIWIDGGECKQGSLTELFRNFNACDSFTNTDCKLRFVCGATGAVSTSDYHIEPGSGTNEFNLILSDNLGNSCLRSTIELGSIVSNITSSLSCGENKLVVTKDGASIDVALPEFTLSKTGTAANPIINLLQNGVICSSVTIPICDGLNCGGDFTAPDNFDRFKAKNLSLPENGNQLKRYKSHKEADNDPNLPSGGYYLVGKYRSIQVKP